MKQEQTNTNKRESTIASILKYVQTAPKWQGNDFDECLKFVNNIRA